MNAHSPIMPKWATERGLTPLQWQTLQEDKARKLRMGGIAKPEIRALPPPEPKIIEFDEDEDEDVIGHAEQRGFDRVAEQLRHIEALPNPEWRAKALGRLADYLTPHPDYVLTLKDMAAAYGVSCRVARGYCSNGLLKPQRCGGALWFTLKDERRLGEILNCKRLGLTLREVGLAAA